MTKKYFCCCYVIFLCLSTIIAYYSYYAKKEYKAAFIHIKKHYFGYGFYRSVKTAELWALGNISVGSMTELNMIAIRLLAIPALRIFKDGENRGKAEKNPMLDSVKMGIDNAEFWEKECKSLEKSLQDLSLYNGFSSEKQTEDVPKAR
nr:alanine:cation symporter family protein [Anoxybacillus tepidamans]